MHVHTDSMHTLLLPFRDSNTTTIATLTEKIAMVHTQSHIERMWTFVYHQEWVTFMMELLACANTQHTCECTKWPRPPTQAITQGHWPVCTHLESRLEVCMYRISSIKRPGVNFFRDEIYPAFIRGRRLFLSASARAI